MFAANEIECVVCLGVWMWISIGINISIIINENVTTDVSLAMQTKDFFLYKRLYFDRFEIEKGERESE